MSLLLFLGVSLLSTESTWRNRKQETRNGTENNLLCCLHNFPIHMNKALSFSEKDMNVRRIESESWHCVNWLCNSKWVKYLLWIFLHLYSKWRIRPNYFFHILIMKYFNNMKVYQMKLQPYIFYTYLTHVNPLSYLL
jgi:hypothetical protein